jgi:hypothetical protein
VKCFRTTKTPLKSRQLRNCFEYFDEHLHAWVDSLDNQRVIDRNFGPASMWCSTDDFKHDKKCVLRNFDESNSELLFRDEEYSLGPVIQEIQILVNKLNENTPIGIGTPIAERPSHTTKHAGPH